MKVTNIINLNVIFRILIKVKTFQIGIFSSDEPQLKLKDFWLGLARDLFPLSSKSKISRKQAENLILIYRTRAIITRSRFETSLDYKPWILGPTLLV